MEGSGIDQEHCRVEVSQHRVILHPVSGQTYINGILIENEREMCQGDIIQFGHFLKFRFNNPIEAEKLRDRRRSGRFSPFPGERASPAVSTIFIFTVLF